MINSKRVRAYKNVHKAKFRFSHSPVTAACRHHSNNLYLTGTSGGAQRDGKKKCSSWPFAKRNFRLLRNLLNAVAVGGINSGWSNLAKL
jgi:hypothetical protein